VFVTSASNGELAAEAVKEAHRSTTAIVFIICCPLEKPAESFIGKRGQRVIRSIFLSFARSGGHAFAGISRMILKDLLKRKGSMQPARPRDFQSAILPAGGRKGIDLGIWLREKRRLLEEAAATWSSALCRFSTRVRLSAGGCCIVGLAVALLAPVSARSQQQTPPPSPVASTVVVLGSPEPVTEGESARSVVLIDTKAYPLTMATPEDFLRTDSSVFLEDRGAGLVQSDISLRGGSFEQTMVLLNGLRVDDAQTSHHNMDLPVPLEAMSNIEVLHGAGSTLYGADALSGVVDFVTAAPTEDSLRLRAGVGSYGENEQGVLAGALGKNFGHDWSEALSGQRAFSTGFMPDRDYRSENASSESRYATALGETDVLLAGSDQAFGANQFYGDYNSWERTKGWYSSIQQELGSKTQAAFGYRRHTDNFILLRDDPAYYANNHIDSSWEAVLRRKDTLAPGVALFSGLEEDGDEIDSNNLGEHARNQGAGYLDLDWRVAQRATLSAGLREEILSGGARSVLSPDLAGSLWVAHAFKLRAAGGYGFRLPTYTDLYYSDPTTDGNPNLKPESAWSGEGGVDWYGGNKVTASLTVFYERQHDAIDYVRANASQKWQASNLTGVRFTGFESSVEWQPARNQSVRFSWTVLAGAQSALDGLQSEYIFNYPVNNASADWTGAVGKGIVLHNRVAVAQRYHQTAYPVWDVSAVRERGWLRPYLRMTNLSNTGYEEIEDVRNQGRAFVGGFEFVLAKR
jgi:iron complex outermembrane receptor protein